MTNAAAFKKATSASKSGFTAKRVIATIIAVTVVVATGLAWLFFDHSNEDQRDTTSIHLSATCDGKPSSVIERGNVGQFNGQQIRLENADLDKTIISFDGAARFDKVVVNPAGAAINGSDFTIAAVHAAAGKNGPFEIYSASMNGYDKSVTVC